MDLHKSPTEKNEKPYNLHNLVARISEAHKSDIQLYTNGHLNFKKFTKDSSDKNHFTAKWQSFRKKPEKLSSLEKPASTQKKMQLMSDALFDFSLGSSGIIPVQKSSTSLLKTTSPLAPTASLEKVEHEVLQKVGKEMPHQDKVLPQVVRKRSSASTSEPISTGYRKLVSSKKFSDSNKVCVEEMKLPELMLSPIDSAVDLPPSLRLNRSPAEKLLERKKFITTHLAGITNKDQFQKMMDFEENVLHTSELKERTACDGHKAVSHLENKLVSKLLLMQIREPTTGPSFERLQIYSDVWNDLVMDSSIFGSLFSEIKDEYDNYLSHLLDVMKLTDRTDILQSHDVMDDISSKAKSKKAKAFQREVEDLENNCREALIRNYTLHEQINEEVRKIEEEAKKKEKEEKEALRRSTPKKKSDRYTTSLAAVSMQRTSKQPVPDSKEKTLKNMRTDIWAKIDAIKALKQVLKDDYVPKVLHRNVLHAIKDTELEIQKQNQQHAYLSQHKEEITEQLKACLSMERVKDEDKKKIWSLIENSTTPSK